MEKDYLTLILTLKCKENCPFCYIDKRDVSMEEGVAKKIVDFFINKGGEEKTIKFFGGEPLLEFSLLKKIVYFCKDRIKRSNKRLNFILPTTGTLLNEEILNFVKLHQIELILDSMRFKKIKKDIFKKLFYLPFLTLTINVSPKSVINLSEEFNRFYNLGFRRFNILPLYYINWPGDSPRILKEELKKIKFFCREHPEIYFKNIDFKGDVPLFNTCLTCDVSGNIFSSNIILFKNFSKFKKNFLLGNIHNIDTNKELVISKDHRLENVINKTFSKKILRDTFKIDDILNAFVDSLTWSIKIADIKLGNTCNNHCKFCVRREGGQKILDKTTDEIKKNLQEAKIDCRGVVFTGGEPSIRKDFLELLSYAKRLGYEKIQVQTNSRMFAYKEFCQKAIQAGANEFGVSIHGHIPELHDYLTSSPGSFYQTVKGIKNLKELSQPVFTNTVIVKSNYRHLPQIAKLLVDLGVDQFQFAFVHALGSAKENFESVVPRMSMVMPYVKEGLGIGMRAGIKVMTEAIPYCLMDEYKDYIAEKLIPSTKVFEFYNEVIDFDKVRPEMAKAKGKDCRNCRYFAVCEGTWREYPHKFGWGEFNPVLKSG